MTIRVAHTTSKSILVQLTQLKPGRDQIEVTRENGDECIRLWLDFGFRGEFKEPLKGFVDGFHSLIPKRPFQCSVPMNGEC
jgi:hypothetical protein